jgi:RNA polymerase sigma-70 factor, ECF subfamily
MQAAELSFGQISGAMPFLGFPVLSNSHAMPMGTDSKADKGELDYSALIEAIATRQDRAAFAALFGFFAPRIKGFLIRSGLAAGTAEDLAQEAMLSVWRKAAQFDPSYADASAWIFAIARNLRIDSFRRDRRAALIEFDPSDSPDEPHQPDVAILASERERFVRAAMTQLSDEQAQVVELSFFTGKPHAEIARDLGLPLGTVKSRLRLAVKRLRELVVDYA